MIDYSPLVRLMKKQHLNYNELKALTGISDGALRLAVYEGNYIKTSTLSILCKKLNCEIKDILTWKQGKQRAIGKPQKVFIRWEVLEEKLKRRNLTISKGGIKVLGRSVNYLTKLRHEGKPVPIEEATALARYCHVEYSELTIPEEQHE